MPEYEITYRLVDRDDVPRKIYRLVASDPDTARRLFLDEHPRTIVCGAPIEVRGNVSFVR